MRVGVVAVLCLTLACSTTRFQAVPSTADLVAVRDGFVVRRDALFRELGGRPFRPGPRRPHPHYPDQHATFTRPYSYSVTGFAMKAFWLGELGAEANAALIEHSDYYIQHPEERDDHANFYWVADVLTRIVEFFGGRQPRIARRLTSEAEAKILESMWLWSKNNSRLVDAEIAVSRTWRLHISENHHLQEVLAAWHFAKLLAADDRYRARAYDDGKTAAEHHTVWTAYLKEYLRQRAMRGLFVEVASRGYGFASAKALYNLHDFADDPTLRKRAGYLLDLWWATWAQEQLGGARGGAASRIYPDGAERADEREGLAWLHFGIGRRVAAHDNLFTPLTSDYRPDLVVVDLAMDQQGRGVYQVLQRPLGLLAPGQTKSSRPLLRTDFGGIVRVTTCTPDFVLGTFHIEARPAADWSPISSQNRWNGIVFAGGATMFADSRAGRRAANQMWGAQSKGTAMVQKLRTHDGGGPTRVWIPRTGVGSRVEREGWVFVETSGAFAAVRPASRGYHFGAGEEKQAGDWMVLDDDFSPVVFEVARRRDFADPAAFQGRVLAGALTNQGQDYRYRSLSGDEFVFPGDQTRLPVINGAPIAVGPGPAFEGPFVEAAWGSGVVTLRKGAHRVLMDFNEN